MHKMTKIGALCLLVTLAPPSNAADGGVERWEAKAEKIEQSLVGEKWRSARRQATNLLDSLSRNVASAGDAENRLFARAALHRALAHAGAGDLERAYWDWHIAESFDADEAGRDLSAFKEPGRLLHEYRRRFAEESVEMPDTTKLGAGASGAGTITSPRRRPSALPSPTGRPSLFTGGEPVVIQAIIDAEGRVVSPRLVKYSRPSRAFEALDLIKKWRYHPATLDGQPVSVFFNLTVNF